MSSRLVNQVGKKFGPKVCFSDNLLRNSLFLISPDKTTSIGRCAHASFVRNNKLYLHGGYGASGSKTGFTAFSLLEAIDLQDFSCSVLQYKSVVANVERRWHQSFVKNDKFFIHGGWNDRGPPGLDGMIYLDLGTMEWATITYDGPCPPSRRWHSMIEVQHSDKFLMFGGYNGDKKNLLSDMYIFDLEKSNWNKIERPGSPLPRAKHSWVQLSPKQYMLIGGQDNRGANLPDLNIFHTDDCSWGSVKNTKEFFEAYRAHSKATKVSEHGIIVGGGYIQSYITPFYFLDTRVLRFQ